MRLVGIGVQKGRTSRLDFFLGHVFFFRFWVKKQSDEFAFGSTPPMDQPESLLCASLMIWIGYPQLVDFSGIPWNRIAGKIRVWNVGILANGL